MTFSQNELDLLKLVALCKDIPINCGELFKSEIFQIDFIESLYPYIVKSKSGLSYRLSKRGYALLDKMDIPYCKDSFSIGKGSAMNKRLMNAKVVLSLYSKNVNIFSDDLPRFIPAFVFRRQNPKGITLGASQFAGLLEEHDRTDIVFYIERDMKLNPYMEIEAAKRFMMIKNTNMNFSVLFMNEDKENVNLWVSENNAESIVFHDSSEGVVFIKIGD